MNNEIKPNLDNYDVSEFINIFNNSDKKRIIIFGPNGTGKSTVGNEIVKLNDEKFSYVSISDGITLIKNFIKVEKNKLIIKIDSKRIQDLENKIADLKKEFDNSKDNSGLTTAKLDKIRNDISNFDMKDFEGRLNCPKITRKDLIHKIAKTKVGEYANQIKENPLETIVAKSIFALIEVYKKNQENYNDNACELCDSKVSKHEILEMLDIKAELIEKLISDSDVAMNLKNIFGEDITNDELINIIESIPSLNKFHNNNKKAADELLVCSFLTNNNKSLEELNKLSSQINDYENQISEIRNEWSVIFTQLEMSKNIFEQFLTNRLGLKEKSLNIDDKKKIISIQLDRDFNTFSSGEKNLLTLFMALNKNTIDENKVIILDDPFTSYDIANQFVMVNFMMEFLISKDKEFVVTSHSLTFLKILYYFYDVYDTNSTVDVYSFDRWRGSLKINYYENLKNLFDTFSLNDDYIELLSFIEKQKNELVQVIINNQEPKEIKLSNLRNKIFHHSFKKDFKTINFKTTINNKEYMFKPYDLIDLIDNFKKEDIQSDPNFGLKKLKYLLSIRLWVESKLFECNENEEGLNSISKQEGTYQKICEFNKKFGSKLKDKFVNFDEGVLKSFIIMMNDAVHSSQTEFVPFDQFALNITTDQLISEIESIKEMFS
jgi:ABC-type dipeptide/oligopeptide/nickel transport system ATPase subunit